MPKVKTVVVDATLAADDIERAMEAPVEATEAEGVIEAAVFGDNEDDSPVPEETMPDGFEELNMTEESAESIEDWAESDIVTEILQVAHEVVEDEEEKPSREEMIETIKSYHKMVNIPFLESAINMYTDEQLVDHLKLLDANNGGSWDMASAIANATSDYKRFVESELLNSKLKLIDKKSMDYVAVAQRITKALGSDAVVQGVKIGDYHTLLRNLAKNYSVLFDKVLQLGESLGIRIPENVFDNEDGDVPVVEGMPHNPKIALLVLNVFLAHVDKFYTVNQAINDTNKRLSDQLATVKAESERLKKETEGHRESNLILRNTIAKSEQNSFYVIRDRTRGGYLRQIDPDKKIENVRDLDLRGELFFDGRPDSKRGKALELPTKSKARNLAERLMANPRFKKRDLFVKQITVVSV
tara:strand:+ start:1137 stop:2375 length:1239 start_codon:yes stop_codon:yes gene_type:complete